MNTNAHNLVGHIALSARKRRSSKGTTTAAQAEQQLTDAIGNAQDELYRAMTVFPFTLFPDTITVDRSQLTVTHRTFFKVGEVISIRIEDILNIAAQVGPFLGSVKISTRFFSEKEPFVVNYMSRGDALRLERVVHGYIIALKKKIDTSSLSAHELSTLLDQLGKGTPSEDV